MPDEPFAVVAGVVSIHGNPVAFVSVVFRPDHRVELALPLGAAEYAATCSTSPPSTRPFNGATLLSAEPFLTLRKQRWLLQSLY